MRAVLLILAIVLCAGSCSAQVVHPIGPGAPLNPGGPAGPVTLINTDGAPVAGAMVVVRTFTGYTFTPGSQPRMALEKTYTANAQGQVTLDMPIPQKMAYVPYSDYALILAPDCCVTVLSLCDFTGQITLLPEKSVEARITLPDGQPAPGAVITLLSIVDFFQFNAAECGTATPQLTMTAGKDGVARIPLINTAQFTQLATTQMKAIVTAGKPETQASYVAYPVSMTISEKAKPFEIKLTPAATVTGKVAALDGTPLAGVRVAHASVPCPPVLTDKRGEFVLGGFPQRTQGNEAFVFSHPDYIGIKLSVPCTTPTMPLIRLHPRITIHGRIVNAETGTPLTGVFALRAGYLVLPDGNIPEPSTENLQTAADGTFTIRIAPKCMLLAFGDGYDGTPLAITREFTDNEAIDLKVQRSPKPPRGLR